VKSPRNQFSLQNIFDFPGYGRASQRVLERDINSRPKTQLNRAEAPISVCPETESWYVIKQNAQHFFPRLSEMRDHTQENKKKCKKKCFPKVYTPRTEWV
jgi:hypothetical protein